MHNGACSPEQTGAMSVDSGDAFPIGGMTTANGRGSQQNKEQ
jgi:hypothetical protein